jgi:hypothetical protein
MPWKQSLAVPSSAFAASVTDGGMAPTIIKTDEAPNMGRIFESDTQFASHGIFLGRLARSLEFFNVLQELPFEFLFFKEFSIEFCFSQPAGNRLGLSRKAVRSSQRAAILVTKIDTQFDKVPHYVFN